MLKFIMNPFKSAMAATLLLVFATISCQKGTTEKPSIPSIDISIEEAKNWLSAGPSGLQSVSNQHSHSGIPDWGNAQSFRYPDKSSILKVPLTDYNLSVGYRDILFQKDSNGIVLGALQEVRPDSSYLAEKGRTGSENMRQFVSNEDFTGDIIIFDPFNNTPLRGRRFKDGLLTGELKYRPQALMMVDDPTDPVDPKKKPGALDDDGPGFEIDLLTVEVTAPGPHTPSTPGTNIPFPSEPVLPKPGGPVTPNNPIPIGGGGGGSTSSSSGLREIKSELKNPCLTEAYKSAINANLKNFISTTITRVFGGKNSNIDLIFRERPKTEFGEGVFGEYDRIDSHINEATENGQKIYVGEMFIDLNIDILPSRPKEYITTVILHESLHTYLTQEGIRFDKSYINQHETIASAYTDRIATALKEIYPTMPTEDCKALGWSGLAETLLWTSNRIKEEQANDSKFSNMIAPVLLYQNGTKGTPSGCK